MKHIKLLLTVLISLSIVSVLSVCAYADETSISITEENFPDEYFRLYISNTFDLDDDGILNSDELNSITAIDIHGLIQDGLDFESLPIHPIEFIPGEGIVDPYIQYYTEYRYMTDITGIGLFPNLSSIYVADCHLETVDVSEVDNLESLTLYRVGLIDFNIGTPDNLTYLNLRDNVQFEGLSEDDLALATGLETLILRRTNITELDVTDNVNLRTLNVSYTPIRRLVIGNREDIETLNIGYCPYLDFDITGMTGLRDVNLYGSQNYYLSSCPNLVRAYLESPNNLHGIEGFGNLAFDYVINADTPDEVHIRISSVQKVYVTENGEFEDMLHRLFICYFDDEWQYISFLAKNSFDILTAGGTGEDVVKYLLFDYANLELDDYDYVSGLYESLYGRYALEEEVTYWCEHLNNGLTREDLVQLFIDSYEWVSKCEMMDIAPGGNHSVTGVESFVERLYTECLNREKDDEGCTYWVNELLNYRMTGSEVARLFFLGEEFMSFDTDNSDFVSRLYATMMGREADADGLDYWVSRLESGDERALILAEFAASYEWSNICSSYGINR